MLPIFGHTIRADLALKKEQSFTLKVPVSIRRQHHQNMPPDDGHQPGDGLEPGANSDLDTDTEDQPSPLASRNQRCSSITTQAASEVDHVPLQKELPVIQTCQNCIRSQPTQHGLEAEVEIAQLRSELKAARSRTSQLDTELDDVRIREAETTCRWKSSVAELGDSERQIKYLQVESSANGIANHDVELGLQIAQLRNRNIELRMENDNIRNQRDLLQSSQRFAADDWKGFENLDVQKVVRDVGELKSKLKRFMQGLDLAYSNPGHDVNEQSFLAALFREALGSNTNALEENQIDVSDFSGFKLRVILISLISAALRMWIFDADVQDIFTNNGLAYAKLTSLLTGAGTCNSPWSASTDEQKQMKIRPNA